MFKARFFSKHKQTQIHSLFSFIIVYIVHTCVLSPTPPHHKCRDFGGNFSKAYTCSNTACAAECAHAGTRARMLARVRPLAYGVSEKRASYL